MENKLVLNWTCLHNSYLREYLISNSQQILNSIKKILNGDESFGTYLSKWIVTPNMASTSLMEEKELFHILQIFSHMNPEYHFVNFELQIKNKYSNSTPLHSDRYTWIHSDKNLVNQAWILLYNDSTNNYRNLDLFSNSNCGLCESNSYKIMTLNGYNQFNQKLMFNGKSLKLGDILLFQNGIIHGTNDIDNINESENDTYRLALTMSFYKRDWILTQNLKSYYYNFWKTDTTDIKLSQRSLINLIEHPYAIKIFGTDVFVPLENPIKVEKDQDEEWFEHLRIELSNLKF